MVSTQHATMVTKTPFQPQWSAIQPTPVPLQEPRDHSDGSVTAVGNAPRNSVRGPSFRQMDVVAAKDFPLPVGDQTRLQIRLEAFKVLNKTNLRRPNGNRSSGGIRYHHVHV
jgi:hypothetical protein